MSEHAPSLYRDDPYVMAGGALSLVSMSPDSMGGSVSYSDRPGSSRGYDGRPLTSGTAGTEFSCNSDASFNSEFSSSGSSFTSAGGGKCAPPIVFFARMRPPACVSSCAS